MTNFIKDNNIDLSNHIEIDVVDVDSTILNEGSSSIDDQYVIFNSNGKEVLVSFTLYLDGVVLVEAGDAYNQESKSVEISDKLIENMVVVFEDEEIDLDIESINIIESRLLELF